MRSYYLLLSTISLYFRFYLECLLPEIVDPLYGKRFELSDIREPEYIQEAQKKNYLPRL